MPKQPKKRGRKKMRTCAPGAGRPRTRNLNPREAALIEWLKDNGPAKTREIRDALWPDSGKFEDGRDRGMRHVFNSLRKLRRLRLVEAVILDKVMGRTPRYRVTEYGRNYQYEIEKAPGIDKSGVMSVEEIVHWHAQGKTTLTDLANMAAMTKQRLSDVLTSRSGRRYAGEQERIRLTNAISAIDAREADDGID